MRRRSLISTQISTALHDHVVGIPKPPPHRHDLDLDGRRRALLDPDRGRDRRLRVGVPSHRDPREPPTEPHAEFVQRPLSTQLHDLAQAAAEPRYFQHHPHDDVEYQQDDDLELEQGEALFEGCARLVRQLLEREPGGGGELAHPGRRRRACGMMRSQREAAA